MEETGRPLVVCVDQTVEWFWVLSRGVGGGGGISNGVRRHRKNPFLVGQDPMDGREMVG